MEKEYSDALAKQNNQLEISQSQQTKEIDTHGQNADAVQDSSFNSTPQIYTKSGNLKKKVGRKPANTGMKKRKDVVLKTVLRKIRNLMRKDFLRHSGYFKMKRNNRLRNLKVLLSDYILNVMREIPTDSMIETLGIIICADDYESYLNILSIESSSFLLKELKTEIKEVLYKFSYSKFLRLLNRSEVVRIFLNFIGKILILPVKFLKF